MRSPPPAKRLVASIQARMPGASVTTAPATRPNQSKPLTALATSSAVASSHRPSSRPTQAATTPQLHHHDGHAVEQRLHPVLADGRLDPAASTWRRCSCTAGRRGGELDGAHRLEGDTSERPKPARAVDEAAADRPATRRPNDDATAEATMTASSTAPPARCRR